jgi:hypothetical protein
LSVLEQYQGDLLTVILVVWVTVWATTIGAVAIESSGDNGFAGDNGAKHHLPLYGLL